MTKAKSQSVIPIERIARHIYLIRALKVMLDSDLAELYGVTIGRLNEQVRDCHRTSESIYRYLRQDLVVPFSMEGIAFNVECGDLFIGDLEAGRVEV